MYVPLGSPPSAWLRLVPWEHLGGARCCNENLHSATASLVLSFLGVYFKNIFCVLADVSSPLMSESPWEDVSLVEVERSMWRRTSPAAEVGVMHSEMLGLDTNL